MVYYGTTFYPDCTVTFKLRRASWVDRKVVVLPIIRENFLDALMDMNGLKTGMGNLHFILYVREKPIFPLLLLLSGLLMGFRPNPTSFTLKKLSGKRKRGGSKWDF